MQQIRQPGVAFTEIVDSDFDASCGKLGKHLMYQLNILQCFAFRNLQNQFIVLYLSFFDSLINDLGKTRVKQLFGRNIYRHAQRSSALGSPFRQLHTGLAQYPAAYSNNLTSPFR